MWEKWKIIALKQAVITLSKDTQYCTWKEAVNTYRKTTAKKA